MEQTASSKCARVVFIGKQNSKQKKNRNRAKIVLFLTLVALHSNTQQMKEAEIGTTKHNTQTKVKILRTSTSYVWFSPRRESKGRQKETHTHKDETQHTFRTQLSHILIKTLDEDEEEGRFAFLPFR